MFNFVKLFDRQSGRAGKRQDVRRDPELFGPGKNGKKRPRANGSHKAQWQEIRDRLQGEVRALVSRSIVESIYSRQPGVAYEDREVLLQSSANRIYADTLYDIASVGVRPPFEPSEEILDWVREALDETVTGWQLAADGSHDRDYQPPVEDKRAMTDAISAALERASQNAVLLEAARRRVRAETASAAAD